MNIGKLFNMRRQAQQAAVPKPDDGKLSFDKPKTLEGTPKPDVVMLIEMKRTAQGDAYKFSIPPDLMEALKLLKLLEIEITRQMTAHISPSKSLIKRI